MKHDGRVWSESGQPLSIEVFGRTWTTRIPGISDWAAVVVLHPFEVEDCQPATWSEADKQRMLHEIGHADAPGRFEPTTGELDIAQAGALLQILCPTPTTVSLAFDADVLITPSSPHTAAHRDSTGQIQLPERELFHAGRNRFLMRHFTGSGSNLLGSLRNSHGWIEWPGLMWASDCTWMIDSHMDVPFSVVAGTESLMRQVTSCPDLDTIGVARRGDELPSPR